MEISDKKYPGLVEHFGMTAAEAMANQTEATLVSLVDGGNTEALDYTVQTAFPDEGFEVQQDLITESPYLSDRVMTSTVEREDMMPNAMVRDVLVANPQSAKSQEVLTKLDERAEPMPDYMMDQIMAGAEVAGTKETLELELSGHITERSEAYQNLYMHYKTQSEDEFREEYPKLYQGLERQFK